MFRKIAIALNIIVMFFSAAFFAYTFFAKEHLVNHARVFVTEKTLAYSRPAVEMIEKGLAFPLASKLIPSKEQRDIERELADYHSDPSSFIASYTHDVKSTSGRTESGKYGRLKKKILEYYHSILAELVIDLRIFSGSNFLAGLVALLLLFSKRKVDIRQIEIFSLFIFGSVVLSTWMYLDGMSFFRILFKWHLGWSYPLAISGFATYFYTKYRELTSIPAFLGNQKPR